MGYLVSRERSPADSGQRKTAQTPLPVPRWALSRGAAVQESATEPTSFRPRPQVAWRAGRRAAVGASLDEAGVITASEPSWMAVHRAEPALFWQVGDRRAARDCWRASAWTPLGVLITSVVDAGVLIKGEDLRCGGAV